MKCCIPVSVCHVDHKLQQLRGDGGKCAHVGLDNSCVCCFVTGHTQPLLQHGGVSCPLKSDTMRTIRDADAHDILLEGNAKVHLTGIQPTILQMLQLFFVYPYYSDISGCKANLLLKEHHYILFKITQKRRISFVKVS